MTMHCAQPDCSLPIKAKGVCKLHYERIRRTRLKAMSVAGKMNTAKLRIRTPIGMRLSAFRKESGQSLRALCASTGIDHTTYSRMLSDSGTVRLKYYVWLASHHGVTLSELLNADG